MYLSCGVSIETASISSYMKYCDKEKPRLAKMQNQKLLMLQWHSFSEWGMEHIPIVVAPEGGQYPTYEWLQPIAS